VSPHRKTAREEFLTDAAGRDPTSRRGGFERESVPFQGFDHLVDALSDHLRTLSVEGVRTVLPLDVPALERLFPVLQRVTEAAPPSIPPSTMAHAELRRRAFRALCELFARLAARRALVVFIDDLQWADADSADLLGEMMRSDLPGLLWVGCYRSADTGASPFLEKMLPVFDDPSLSPLIQHGRWSAAQGCRGPGARQLRGGDPPEVADGRPESEASFSQ
jgi:hypothetical protein